MVTWLFENHQFTNAWIPFDRVNQKKLEYVYRHYEEIENKKDSQIQVDLEEEDPSIHSLIEYKNNCIYVVLKDTHFEQPITLYPILLLGSLPDRDILIIRAEILDHGNNKYLNTYDIQ